MSLLYVIISCEDLRPLYTAVFGTPVFSFVVVDIMYSSPLALFHRWEGSGLVLCNRRLELSLIVLSLHHFYLLAVRTSWRRDETILNTEK